MLVHDVDRRLDLVGGPDGEPQRDLEGVAELVRVDDVGGVRDDDEHRPVVRVTERECGEPAGKALGEEPRGAVLDPGEVDLDEREVVLLGDEPRNLRARHGVVLDEDLAEATVARDPLLGKRALELLLAHEAVAQEKRSERRGTMGSRMLRHGDRRLILGRRQPGIRVGLVLPGGDGEDVRQLLGLAPGCVGGHVRDRPVDLVLRCDGIP